MKTIKRMPADIKVSGLSNMTKYFNQMQFNGIKKDDNIYAIDQMSLRDAKNVYIDDNLRLVSRPTLQYSDLPPEIPAFSELVDIKDFGSGKVYITKSVLNKYSVIMVPNTPVAPIVGATFIIEELTNYHIVNIEHYVICFNDVNAKIFDTNNADKGWQNLTSYAEVPVVKRVVGETITTYDKNYFIPDLYKEEYIWSNETQVQLPNYTTADIKVNTKLGSFVNELTTPKNYFSYRINRPVNYINDTYDNIRNNVIMSASKNILVLAYSDYAMISYNRGGLFTRVDYPAHDRFMRIASVSKDGDYFFFVAKDGVYRYNLTNKTWSNVFCEHDSLGNKIDIKGEASRSQIYQFLTGNIFCFITEDNDNVYMYFKGNGLYTGTDYTKDHMDDSQSDYYDLEYITSVGLDTPNTTLASIFNNTFNTTTYYDKQIIIKTQLDGNNKTVTAIAISVVKDTSYSDLIYIVGGDTSAITLSKNMFTAYSSLTTSEVNGLSLYSAVFTPSTLQASINGLSIKEKYMSSTYKCNLALSVSSNSLIIVYTDIKELYEYGTTFDYRNMLRQLSDDNDIYLDTATINPRVNGEAIATPIQNFPIQAYSENNYYFVTTRTVATDTGYAIWTNALQDSDTVSITYTIGSAGNFTQVPTVTYSDTELYLAFDNLLQITYNTKDPDDPTKTLFNLPKINNQSFIDKITAMINISTTEIAIFFLNKIIICSKVADENLVQGFRYDYYNTKLSTGVRLGDSVINTLEGSFTLFPTLRGLAAMNYQAFMATTDQTISYITDIVKDMWTKFYNDSKQIRIIQWRNRLVLTNGTGTILLYDLTAQAWWRWELSRDVLVALSNQLDLQVINGTLLTFKENVDQYYDFGERGEFSEIDWYIMSQPLHFNAPNYYKNIKQLVFQMSETEDEKSTKTMDAQIKLYRKKITIREPETVKFKIEELRTFVKRFNYWKINELQWGISNDTETSTPKRLELNGMSVKYEVGEEVR